MTSSAPRPTSPVTVEFDPEQKLVRFAFRGNVAPGHLQPAVAELEKMLRELGKGFGLVTDLTELDRMELECVPHLTRVMDLCLAAGVGKVVRIIPDPDKDIGFKLLSLVHYRGRVPTLTYESRAEAERELTAR